jgi:NAD(P)-dependent dehydrogenase (short-subunit alcohol dehydrogenase family)
VDADSHEAGISQKHGRVRQWARRGSRPRQPANQRYENAYLFGAICPARGTCAGLTLPYANTFATQLSLDEISRHVAKKEVLDTKILPQIPLGRLGRHEEIAGLIIYLCSHEAALVTGANIAINGGQHMQ